MLASCDLRSRTGPGRFRFTPLGLTALLLAGPWAAEPAHAARLHVDASVCNLYAGGQNCDYGDTLDTDNGAQGPELGTSVDFGTGYPTNGHAHVIQGWGVFHGDAQVAYETHVGTNDGGAAMRATAGGMSQEYWTLSGHTGKAYARLVYTVSGSTSVSGSSPDYQSEAYLQVDADTWFKPHYSGERNTGQATTHQVYGAGRIEMDGLIPFYFNEPLLLTVRSGVWAATGYNDGFSGGSYGGYAAASFGHTAVLSGITIVDEHGQVLDGITISAESGTHYPLTPVPEPASAGLFAAGAAVTLLAARCRRRDGRG